MDYYAAIRAAESGGNDRARNPRSSAAGRYQFIESTWNDLARKYPHLGLTDRFDPEQQERAIRVFTEENARALRGAGIDPNGGNLYAAHFLGAGGARSVLTQPDDTPVSAVLSPEVIKANPFLEGMTVGRFRQWAASKGGGGGTSTPPPETPQNALAPQQPPKLPENALAVLDPADFMTSRRNALAPRSLMARLS